ncbi:MAG: gamma-butyrobetaine hydroxylase-like domain-containing protein, partial [Verrucomicrobiota bacterium]
MATRLFPTNIQHIGDELAVAWNDGTESFLKLELMRRACPCAACGGEPDILGYVVRPDVQYTANSFLLRGYEIVGGYALQP